MKRFLLFVVIAVAVVTLGLTIWRFSTNNEVIILHNPEGKVINVGDKIKVDDILDIKNKSEYTNISYESSNSDLLVYDEKRGGFYAQNVGGEASIIVTTSNKNYSKLTMTVTIRDGSEAYPFQIGSAQELAMIGASDSVYGLDDYYELIDDIYVGNLGENYRWTPIGYNSESNGEFNGHFNGNGHTIYNVYITDIYGKIVTEVEDSTPAEANNAETPETQETTETPVESTESSNDSVKTAPETTESSESTEAPAENAEPAEENDSTEASEETPASEETTEQPTGAGYDEEYKTARFANGAGLFYIIGENGKVENLTISKINITGNFLNVGAVASINRGAIKGVDVYDATKTDVITNGENGSFVGGIVGINEGTIYWSSSDANIISNLDLNDNVNAALYAGGIAGKNLGDIFECYYKGAMTRNGSNSIYGGIVGLNDCNTDGTTVKSSTINDCYAIIDSYNTNTATPAPKGGYFGGIVGKDNNFAEDSLNVVSGCYFGLTDAMRETNDQPAKFIAYMIVDGEAQEVAVSYLKSLKELTQSDTFVRVRYATGEKEYWNWNVWQFTTRNDGNPVINKNNTIMSSFSREVKVNKEVSLTISNCEEFIQALSEPNGTYKLVSDIDFSTYTGTFKNYKNGYWYPLDAFAGSIYSEGVDTDGDGIVDRDYAVVSNLKIYNPTEGANAGLFKTWSKGLIENVEFDNITFEGETTKFCGVLAGLASEVEVKNVTIKNVTYAIQGMSTSFGTVFGMYGSANSSNTSGQMRGVVVDNVTAGDMCYFVNAGGLVGYNYKTITAIKNGESIAKRNSVNNVKIVAKYFGGVAGQNFKTIERTDVSNISYKVDQVNTPDIYRERYFVSATEDNAITVGGIVANEREGSTVQFCQVKDSELSVKKPYASNGNVAVRMGGAAGLTRGNINNVEVNNVKLIIVSDSNYETSIINTPYVGGIAGLASGSVVSNVIFSSSSSIDTPVDRDGASYVGGLAGVALNSAKFTLAESCGTVKGYYAGGLAGVAGSTTKFSRCAVSGGKVQGTYIAGLAVYSKNEAGANVVTFDNCYTKATLSLDGNGSNAQAAGMVLAFVNANADGSYSISDPSVVIMNACYTSVRYSGSGTKYAVTTWDGKCEFNFWFIHVNRTYKHIMNSNCFYEYRDGVDNRDSDGCEIKNNKARNNALNANNFDSAYWNIEAKDGGLSLRYITVDVK